ncbi:MAG: glycoside hydrolase family 38 C-terminal domain-containing protein [Planctomycetota bacterium]
MKGSGEAERPHKGTVLENDFFRLDLDRDTGTIEHLIDKSLDQDLVDGEAEWKFLAFIYETLGYRQQLEQYKLDEFERTLPDRVRIHDGIDGEIWKSLRISGASQGCLGDEGVQCEIRLYHHTPRIEFLFTIRKREERNAEGIYVAFPFSLADSKIGYEAQGGTVSPGINQMPGSSSDWHMVQNFACVRNSRAQIIMACDQIPLMQFGGINLGRFQYTAKPEKPHCYSWVMNNYWTTNFCASQSGEFRWSYQLTTSKDLSDSAATRFGWGCRVPIVSRVFPAGAAPGPLPKVSLVREPPPSNLLMVSAKPSVDKMGIVFHWREVDGTACFLDLGSVFDPSLFASFREVNILEEPIAALDGPVRIEAHGVKFIQALFKAPARGDDQDDP